MWLHCAKWSFLQALIKRAVKQKSGGGREHSARDMACAKVCWGKVFLRPSKYTTLKEAVHTKEHWAIWECGERTLGKKHI
jgi:hypothetical protein